MLIAGLIALGTALALLGYWLIHVTEGTYLGTRAVILMYDWTAERYNAIKQLQFVDEILFLGRPMAQVLAQDPEAMVLDVATGTGRLPAAMLSRPEFQGYVIGIDRSKGMLAQAQKDLAKWRQRATLLRQDARALGFRRESFDAVTCLEALEFITEPERALEEMYRVLKPGGTLLISNRIGKEASWFPRRIAGRGKLETNLSKMGWEDVRKQRWQVHYDLIWARKPEQESGREEPVDEKELCLFGRPDA